MATTALEPSAQLDRLSGRVELPRRWLWLLRGFRKYSLHYLRKHFHGVRLAKSGHPFPADGPLLIVLNHPAWWDPLVCMVLSKFIADRDQFAAIDAIAVEKYGFFKKLGFIGVDTHSLRGASEFVRTGATILSEPNRVYWVTAQGRFTDARQRPLNLQAGVGHLAARLEQGIVLPIALEYAFWNERTPEALIRIGEPIGIAEHPSLSGRQWIELIEESLTRTLDELSRETMSRDPARFTTLVSGKAGVGGVYDFWRRMKAWISGRLFDPEHDSSAREK